jgi:hypothetical protein
LAWNHKTLEGERDSGKYLPMKQKPVLQQTDRRTFLGGTAATVAAAELAAAAIKPSINCRFTPSCLEIDARGRSGEDHAQGGFRGHSMSDQAERRRVDAENLVGFCRTIGERAGLRPEDSALVANTLVQADLWGHRTHGVMRLPWYEARLQSGAVDASATPEKVVDFGADRDEFWKGR